MKCTNQQTEILYGVLQKIAKTTDKISRWQMGRRLCRMKEVVELYQESKKAPKAVEDLQKARNSVYDRYGTVVAEVGGIRRYAIPPEMQMKVTSDVMKAEMSHSDALVEEREHEEFLRSLAKEIVEVDLDPIEYEWCGDSVDGNDLAILMGLEMVREPKEEEEKDVGIPEEVQKNLQKQRKKRSR